MYFLGWMASWTGLEEEKKTKKKFFFVLVHSTKLCAFRFPPQINWLKMHTHTSKGEAAASGQGNSLKGKEGDEEVAAVKERKDDDTRHWFYLFFLLCLCMDCTGGTLPVMLPCFSFSCRFFIFDSFVFGGCRATRYDYSVVKVLLGQILANEKKSTERLPPLFPLAFHPNITISFSTSSSWDTERAPLTVYFLVKNEKKEN